MDFSQQFEIIKKSVVNVLVFEGSGKLISSGSGVQIGDGRKVLTCSHCLKRGMHNMVKLSGPTGICYSYSINFDSSLSRCCLDLFKALPLFKALSKISVSF